MKTKFLPIMILLATFFVAQKALAYDFTAVNVDGKTIYYNILSEDEKTCAVTAPQILSGWSSATNFDHYAGNIKIPSSVNGYKVTRIGNQAFLCCRSLTSVEIPNTVTYIGSDAFGRCSGLVSITLPNSVTKMSDFIFDSCI